MSAYVVKTKALIDGTGSEPILGGMFRVEDEKIVAVGKELPADGAEVIDLSEYTVMPGLIDCHTHLSIVPAEGNQLAQILLELLLIIGVFVFGEFNVHMPVGYTEAVHNTDQFGNDSGLAQGLPAEISGQPVQLSAGDQNLTHPAAAFAEDVQVKLRMESKGVDRRQKPAG